MARARLVRDPLYLRPEHLGGEHLVDGGAAEASDDPARGAVWGLFQELEGTERE